MIWQNLPRLLSTGFTNWKIANKWAPPWVNWNQIFWAVSTCFCEWPYDKARYLCWVQTFRTAFPSIKRPSLHCATGGEPTPRKHPEFTRTHALVWSDCNNRTHWVTHTLPFPTLCRWIKRRQCDRSNVCQIPKRWRCVTMCMTIFANACYNVCNNVCQIPHHRHPAPSHKRKESG